MTATQIVLPEMMNLQRFVDQIHAREKLFVQSLTLDALIRRYNLILPKKSLNLINEWHDAGLLLWPSCLSRLQIHVPMLWKCHWVQHQEQVSAYKIYNLIFLFIIKLISYFIRYYQTGVVSSHSSGDEGRGKDMAYLHSTVYTIIGQFRSSFF